ncbi:hypothetical protein DDZ13_02395 [Coraliomargarita sinensis]|uniref:Uncharacterized protein n=1 Tax=Coraliomargarita sinensis TaxID=2174842 RepID=A0A317ZJK8_9BACT|nr:hypothetical protein [Coraliomargarita sinensis]PXA05740.1 hypothetical protein DDZ13_02395 [Coraliomargarita sinensis]
MDITGTSDDILNAILQENEFIVFLGAGGSVVSDMLMFAYGEVYKTGHIKKSDLCLARIYAPASELAHRPRTNIQN